MSHLDEALALWGRGWQVVPAPKAGKAPMGSWRRWQTERVPERTIREAFSSGEANLFVITGAVSRLVVLDCDDAAAEKFWSERLGDAMEQTTRSTTGKGHHYWFELPEGGPPRRGRSSPGGNTGAWDLRAEGGGVVAPPSVHPSGATYEWVLGHGPETIQSAPAALWPSGAESTGGETRSVLAHLLANPAPEGGRNAWLASVAGHYAKHMPFEDAYEQMVRSAANLLSPALPEEEISKLIPSIWRSEAAKEGRVAVEAGEGEDWRENLVFSANEVGEETGWLVSGGDRILVRIRQKKSDGFIYNLSTWCDADLRVLGVLNTDRGRIYEAEVRRPDGKKIVGVLPTEMIATSRKLSEWLGNFGASIGTPDSIHPTRMSDSARLTRYLDAQKVEPVEAVEALGWDEGSSAFITHEGIIRRDGPADFEDKRPDPAIRSWAPYRYGHGGKKVAQGILREVLTFHHETVVSVFGSWWAAALLKAQVSKATSQFPFMALEAASGSGKTTGFFSLMLALSGNVGGHTNPTRAALRDFLAANKCGIVWIDDLDSLEYHGELLRSLTVGGSMVKKAENHHGQISTELRSALVVSGESLGLGGQKALLDRAVLLEVSSPTKRRSDKGDYPQWDDILALKSKYPDLTDYSGSIIEIALMQTDRIDPVTFRRGSSGRHADKEAILRLGADLLEGMVGMNGDWIREHVEAWIESQRRDQNENQLTLKIIPWALETSGWCRAPLGPDPGRRMPGTPAFVEAGEEDIVWFSPGLLAEWHKRDLRSRLDPRVNSEEALTQQARALGLGGRKGAGGGRKPFKLVTGEGTKVYWRLTDELSRKVIARSRGQKEEVDDD